MSAADASFPRFALWLALLTLFAYGLFGAVAGALWFDLDLAQRAALRALLADRVALIALLALLLPVPLGLLLRRWIRS